MAREPVVRELAALHDLAPEAATEAVVATEASLRSRRRSRRVVRAACRPSEARPAGERSVAGGVATTDSTRSPASRSSSARSRRFSRRICRTKSSGSVTIGSRGRSRELRRGRRGRTPGPRAARNGGRRRARARSGARPRAPRARARRARPAARAAHAIAIRPSRIHIHGRGNQRESWLRRSASCALPVRSGSASKSSLTSCVDLLEARRSAGCANSKCHSVGDVQTWRMLWSGREIQTTWPAGIGSPSVGAGSLFPCDHDGGRLRGSA